MELGIASAKRGMQFGEMKRETNDVVFAKDVKEEVNEAVHLEKRMLTKLGQKDIWNFMNNKNSLLLSYSLSSTSLLLYSTLINHNNVIPIRRRAVAESATRTNRFGVPNRVHQADSVTIQSDWSSGWLASTQPSSSRPRSQAARPKFTSQGPTPAQHCVSPRIPTG
ncbi:hypothetical protein V6N12_028815 [Hibiscus sabdariffa]|uniref:Uncharacterized protein n=1 Tax=Hibiscus sabdariffa TaxID=183260 RepID=A0ABR2F702_9ROSI